MGFSPYFLIDVTLGIFPMLIAMSTSSKYIQKLSDHIRWAHKKANLFQQKEAQCHKQNYDQHSKAVSLKMGDMVLVYVTHLQGQAQNSEQMGDQGVCCGTAALPKPTSVCGMSHRWGRAQVQATQKLPAAH